MSSSPDELGAPEVTRAGCDQGSSRAQKKMTPPEAPRVRNPFERALVNRLHTPICSPGMCNILKKQRDTTFRWDIEQRCTLMPVDIVACSSQFEPSPDPHFDRIHEEATEIFFSQEVVVPSPFLQTSKKETPVGNASVATDMEGDNIKILRDVSAQTVLTLPPTLPPELEAMLESFCTYTQDQWTPEYDSDMSWLRRRLQFECASDSEQTDDERTSPEQFEPHAPVAFSPDLVHNAISKGMKRTFGTPLNEMTKKGFHNKILDGAEPCEPAFSPIGLCPATPASAGSAGSSLASQSISPVGNTLSSDNEKPSPASLASENMASCLSCAAAGAAGPSEAGRACVCRGGGGGGGELRRSASLKESPSTRSRSSGRRSLSVSSASERTRSVQRLDFGADMSVDSPRTEFASQSPLAGSDSSGSPKPKLRWRSTAVRETRSDLNIHTLDHEDHHTIDHTPIKSKSKTNAVHHVISQIRSNRNDIPAIRTSMDMSLDDSVENPLNLEDKKIDFNSIDLKLLTSGTRLSNRASTTHEGASFKRMDSGFNENTTFFGKSSYYESAIKPSELTVTDFAKSSTSGASVLKETNVNWMRVDSGFKDETSSDNVQFYTEGASNLPTKFCFAEANLAAPDKENVFIEDFDNFLVRASTRGEEMSISDIFADEMALNCNFSSTPSKNKRRN